jgi:hypothetical protein
VLTPKGKVALVASSARGQRALGIAPGDSAEELDGNAEQLSEHLWTAPLGAKTVAYVVRGGLVRTVAVAGPKAAKSTASLRGYLRRLPRKGVKRRPTTVVSGASARISPKRAVPLVAQRGSPQFPLFCGL